jgi:3,4-dihydroxy 2-butanone 4-phosphate synthase/GTP cyclohydrolase II
MGRLRTRQSPRDGESQATSVADATTSSTVEDALDVIRAGRFVVVVDTARPGQECALVVAAEHASPERVNLMTLEARAPLYLCLSTERCTDLGLLPEGGVPAPGGASRMASVEAREGMTSGVSASDRSRSIRLVVHPETKPSDLAQPGHVPVLRARRGGVLERAHLTEAAVDLANLAGLQPGCVVSQIMADDGSMAAAPDLVGYCVENDIPVISVADLVAFRRRYERLVERTVSVRMPTKYGDFTAVTFRETLTGSCHVALVKGDLASGEDTLVRVHTQCLLGDVFHSTDCDCFAELAAALSRIEHEGHGVVLYLSRAPGRGVGLLERIAARSSADEAPTRRDNEGANDARDYGIGSQILSDLGLTRIRLLTDNPRDLGSIESYGLSVVEQIPLCGENRTNRTSEHHQDVSLG